MKTISWTVARERAVAANDPKFRQSLENGIDRNQSARQYLRSIYTTSEEREKLNPRRPIDEDGLCAGWGCETTLIY